jgi:hypothetical protein
MGFTPGDREYQTIKEEIILKSLSRGETGFPLYKKEIPEDSGKRIDIDCILYAVVSVTYDRYSRKLDMEYENSRSKSVECLDSIYLSKRSALTEAATLNERFGCAHEWGGNSDVFSFKIVEFYFNFDDEDQPIWLRASNDY